MSRLIIFLFSSFFIFNVNAEWIYIDSNQESGTKVFVETETIELEGGIMYWWDLNNYIEPQQEGMISSAMSRGAQCHNNRYVNLEFKWFKGEMATGEVGGSFKPEQEWVYPSAGTIEEKVFNFVCNKRFDYLKQNKVDSKEGIYKCIVLTEAHFWDDEPHITMGKTKEFLFEKNSDTVQFQEDSPFYGATLNIVMEEDSQFGPRFEATSKNSKLMYFYPDDRNIYENVGRFKYTNLGVASGVMGMFSSILASCNPIK